MRDTKVKNAEIKGRNFRIFSRRSDMKRDTREPFGKDWNSTTTEKTLLARRNDPAQGTQLVELVLSQLS
jgi:hypothetical protein